MLMRFVRATAPIILLGTLVAMTAPATSACSGTCSSDEEASCNSAHSSCVAACGNGTTVGASGLPESDPKYDACIKGCGDKLCACLDDCGSSCKK